MPADLPATSGYTYAVEFSVDEAKAAGAIDVRFSSPCPCIPRTSSTSQSALDPARSYDRQIGAWLPPTTGASSSPECHERPGRSGHRRRRAADSGPALGALSITDAERQRLATLYTPGQSLWRVLIPHFDQPWDHNWGVIPPDDAEYPGEDPEPEDLLNEACTVGGNSIIECQNQILGEAVGVVGTAFALHYQSDRVPGRRSAYTVDIPLRAQRPRQLAADRARNQRCRAIPQAELSRTHCAQPADHVYLGRQERLRADRPGRAADHSAHRLHLRGVYGDSARFASSGPGPSPARTRARN